MGDVVSLQQFKEENTPHLSGEAMCQACKHKWIAVAPVGTGNMECPECGFFRGLFIGFAESPKGTPVYTCNYCSGQLFEIAQDRGILCIGCGFVHDFQKVWESACG